MMEKALIVSLGLLAMPALAVAAPATQTGALHLTATVAVPGQPLASFDISSFSDGQNLYGFLALSNHAVDVIDPDTDRFVGRAGGFVEGGPNGLVAVGDTQFWAGDGDSKLRVIDIPLQKIIATIGTGGKSASTSVPTTRKIIWLSR